VIHFANPNERTTKSAFEPEDMPRVRAKPP
jgi:hypothetical protein